MQAVQVHVCGIAGKCSATNCKYFFPKDLKDHTTFDEDGTIHLKRGDGYVNTCSPLPLGLLRCNTDFKPTFLSPPDFLSYYYMTKYMTKNEASNKQFNIMALASQKMHEKYRTAENKSSFEAGKAMIRSMNMRTFTQPGQGP